MARPAVEAAVLPRLRRRAGNRSRADQPIARTNPGETPPDATKCKECRKTSSGDCTRLSARTRTACRRIRLPPGSIEKSLRCARWSSTGWTLIIIAQQTPSQERRPGKRTIFAGSPPRRKPSSLHLPTFSLANVKRRRFNHRGTGAQRMKCGREIKTAVITRHGSQDSDHCFQVFLCAPVSLWLVFFS